MQKNFTLIEMAIVLAIVGVLLTVAVINSERYLQKTRDAKRISDMDILTLALTAFYEDNARYPNAANDNIVEPGECIGAGYGRATPITWGTVCPAGEVTNDTLLNLLINRTDPLRSYLRFPAGGTGSVPRDPLYENAGDRYYYAYDPSHAVDWPCLLTCTTTCTCTYLTAASNCTAGTSIVAPLPNFPLLGFRRLEVNFNERRRDTCSGTELDLNNADYNKALLNP